MSEILDMNYIHTLRRMIVQTPARTPTICYISAVKYRILGLSIFGEPYENLFSNT